MSYTAWASNGRDVVRVENLHPNQLHNDGHDESATYIRECRHRRVIELRDAGVPFKEIAPRVGYTVEVCRRIYRGNHILKTENSRVSPRAGGVEFTDSPAPYSTSQAPTEGGVKQRSPSFSGEGA